MVIWNSINQKSVICYKWLELLMYILIFFWNYPPQNPKLPKRGIAPLSKNNCSKRNLVVSGILGLKCQKRVILDIRWWFKNTKILMVGQNCEVLFIDFLISTSLLSEIDFNCMENDQKFNLNLGHYNKFSIVAEMKLLFLFWKKL